MTETIHYRKVTYFNGEPMKLRDKTINVGDLQPDEILVKVYAAGVNPEDLLLYNTAKYLFFKRNEKAVGRDFAGIVHAVGSQVTEYKVGDRVSGLFTPFFTEESTFTEFLRINPKKVPSMGKFPKGQTFIEAASFPLVLATAINILQKFHKPNENSRVLVLGGATAVGHYIIQILKNHYKAQSVVSVNSADSAELVTSLGADIIIDYKTENVPQRTLDIVKNDFNGSKFDMIIDCIGNKELFPIMDSILKPKSEPAGYVSIVGDEIMDYHNSFFKIFWKNIFLKRILPFFRSYNYILVAHDDYFYPFAKQLFDEGKLKIILDSVYPWEEFEVALKKQATHRARGKIVLELVPESSSL